MKVRTAFVGKWAFSQALIPLLLLACHPSESVRPAADLVAEFRGGLGEPSVLDRQLIVAPLLEELDPDNVESVAAVYLESSQWLAPIDIEIFLDTWGRMNGLEAYEFARLLPDSVRSVALVAAVHGWAIVDLPHALRVVSALWEDEPKLGRQLLEPMVRGWVHSPDPGLKTFLLESPLAGDLLNAAVPEVYRKSGGGGLRSWSEDLISESEDEKKKWLIFRKAVRAYALRSPEEAAVWANDLYGKADYARDGPEMVALAWLRRDPIRAFEWLRLEVAQDLEPKVSRIVFRRWSENDPEGARNWLVAQADDPFLYPVYHGQARQLAASEPREAVLWCGRIPVREGKMECFKAVAGDWYGYDPVEAGRWMEDSGLEFEDREEIRLRWQRRWRRKSKPGQGEE